MRLHTSLTWQQLIDALDRTKTAGRIAPDVQFASMTEYGSRAHSHSFEIRLGTDCKFSLPAGYTDQRGHRLTARRSAGHQEFGGSYAATWHEWGWLINEIFTADPGARWGSEKNPRYADPADFERKTNGAFDPQGMIFPEGQGT
jgi:hypothetical protein